MQRTLDDLPQEYASRLVNVDFRVRRALSLIERRQMGMRAELYGLYQGIPLTHRSEGYDRAMPDRITLFWGALLRDFPDEEALAEQVHKTLYHEIGHYFGLSDADLRRTSVE
jgi:predicted Zn-dependent protease with MMP-like domain